MNNKQTSDATVTRRFSVSQERVFDSWLDPEKVMKWMFPEGDIVRVEIDARVGGSFSFVDRREGMEIDHTGEYIEIDRASRLVFTWGIPKETPDFDRVIIEIIPTDSGCKLSLIHQLHPNWSEYAPQTEKAWSSMLEAMDKAIS